MYEEYPYRVVVYGSSGLRYRWVMANCGKRLVDWDVSSGPNTNIYRFKEEEMAILFILKWA
jgi:hypothetical protein